MSAAKGVSSESSHHSTDVVIVDASETARWIDFKEIWRYRNLIWIFAVRDVTVKYRQTVVGIAWTVIQPISLMIAFGVLKSVLVGKPGDTGVPDQVSTFSGLLLYQLFAGIVGASTLCLVDNRQMVTKVYFPRVSLPLSACLRPVLDFTIGVGVFTLLLLWFRVLPSPGIVFAPFVILLTMLAGLSIGLWLSALNAQYRDFGYIVPFLLNLGLLISPVAIDTNKLPDQWRLVYFANPMATLLELFRATIFATPIPHLDEILVSFLSGMVVFVSGIWYFHHADRVLADRI